ncbi:threonylcarbamoyl-AMP synthase [Candidatus Aerophobetes bacterium]|uniref:L-threonylcarbamoyladenylate synthase n=1 Tax=Aerophobetes bacterium TaxID=2030807 RepID=A0A2A4YMQ2_UNCAE|nr:MAG: threonylcarbamoyl-AMP synthase [Candidatus Aerophobetes bacterium]
MLKYQVAAKLLTQGELVALPTDTVYGIAAKADDISSVEKLFTLKKRPKFNPLTICLSDVEDLFNFLENENDLANVLAKRFWPGALTIVTLVKKEKVHPLIRAGSDYCGFRIADSDPLRVLIKEVGPIVLPSANISGNQPLIAPSEIKKIFPGLFVIEGKCNRSSVPSTVIKVDNGITVLREGKITRLMLDEALK